MQIVRGILQKSKRLWDGFDSKTTLLDLVWSASRSCDAMSSGLFFFKNSEQTLTTIYNEFISNSKNLSKWSHFAESVQVLFRVYQWCISYGGTWFMFSDWKRLGFILKVGILKSLGGMAFWDSVVNSSLPVQGCEETYGIFPCSDSLAGSVTLIVVMREMNSVSRSSTDPRCAVISGPSHATPNAHMEFVLRYCTWLFKKNEIFTCAQISLRGERELRLFKC